jgi:hypothetical protein
VRLRKTSNSLTLSAHCVSFYCEDFDVEPRIILQCFLKKVGGRMWTAEFM